MHIPQLLKSLIQYFRMLFILTAMKQLNWVDSWRPRGFRLLPWVSRKTLGTNSPHGALRGVSLCGSVSWHTQNTSPSRFRKTRVQPQSPTSQQGERERVTEAVEASVSSTVKGGLNWAEMGKLAVKGQKVSTWGFVGQSLPLWQESSYSQNVNTRAWRLYFKILFTKTRSPDLATACHTWSKTCT